MAKRRNALCSVAAVLVLLTWALPLTAWSQLKFAASINDRVSKTMAERVLAQAYRQLGITPELVPLPIRRGYNLSDLGGIDGVAVSVADDLGPHLIKIPVPIAYEEAVVYTVHKRFTVNGFASLQPYSIGHLAGLRYFETRLQGMRVDTASDLETLFRKLDLGRTDVVVESRFNQCTLKQLGLNKVVILEPALENVPGHHFVSQQHADLVPRLTAVLQKMEKDGSIKKIQAGVVREYQARCG